jgi:hypothetical protein
LAESGAGDQTIMDIAGHVSRQMARYSHIRMEAKRTALEAIEAKPQPVKPEQKEQNSGTEERHNSVIGSRAGHKTPGTMAVLCSASGPNVNCK